MDSAVVTLNGLEVTSPSAFNETVLSVVRSVSVSADNVLTVELRADPGSGFTLQIVLRTSCTGNALPMADAGADQTVFAGTLFQLDGGGSTDLEGAALTYGWSFLSEPTASAVLPTFMVDLPGAYTLELVVNDGHADSQPDTVSINTENSQPVAVAGPDQEALVGDSVQLDGSGWTDVDGDPVTYLWAFTVVPAGSLVMLSYVAVVDPTF